MLQLKTQNSQPMIIMHIFQNSNPFLYYMDTIRIKLNNLIIQQKSPVQHDTTSQYDYIKRQITHYISNECLFISLQWSDYQLTRLLTMISHCCVTLNLQKWHQGSENSSKVIVINSNYILGTDFVPKPEQISRDLL